jgi:hypothetical protein
MMKPHDPASLLAEYEKIVAYNDQVPSEKKIIISREELEKPSNKLLRGAKVSIYKTHKPSLCPHREN